MSKKIKKGLTEIKPKEPKKIKPEIKPEEPKEEFEVGNPIDLRPKELPLIVKPKGGKWDNEAQEKYASILNAYAYVNPEKWEIKKASLLKRLSEIGKNPSAIKKYQIKDEIVYGNKLK